MNGSNTSLTNESLFVTALFITFLALKLSDAIDWSWWWVFAPLWIPLVFAVVLIIIMVFVFGVVYLRFLKKHKSLIERMAEEEEKS